MPIIPQQVVTLHYMLRDAEGHVLDDSRQRDAPLSYLHGHDNIVAGLEQALTGAESGTRLTVTLAPEQAYGRRDEALVRHVSRSAFGDVADLKPGMRFQAQGPDGPRTVTVVDADDTRVTVDANHPLAGQTLHYDVDILEVREATRAELAKGHPLDEDVDHTQVEDRKQF
ncbi:peptidylprolyl isomerase [Halomonas sp. McH1-25]|uniref:FKBP-type peptidyl-prolyl cis-trans isomerase n=1 Tax=unclassified Halomonas TaxID=2609666 RepID=UPI001EF59120|nr:MULTISPECIES: peptidylprolyl isomerase [unclassified Halomonas]MCG7598197.1 peptidylprolyl isomerase [Halomonas sp. McH1-25]MCP1341020.1 peptidylprolyl isomerase [Halomonas sp. FL8]MCP1360917.1 peptidylprolyl isomerase [Halomonas sp. BBD45]MCP1365308.1 peptidylprolyl isomerase [Halomonas sp. BBD48]